MATETGTGEVDPERSHRRSVTITAIATLGGALAGIAASQVATGPNDPAGIAALVVATLAEFGLMKAAGIDVGEFSTKDNLYVAFMSFALWFIVWGVLLTAGV